VLHAMVAKPAALRPLQEQGSHDVQFTLRVRKGVIPRTGGSSE
jgi:hypothetical protein